MSKVPHSSPIDIKSRAPARTTKYLPLPRKGSRKARGLAALSYYERLDPIESELLFIEDERRIRRTATAAFGMDDSRQHFAIA